MSGTNLGVSPIGATTAGFYIGLEVRKESGPLETIVLILAVALIGIGIFGAWPLLAGEGGQRQAVRRSTAGGVLLNRGSSAPNREVAQAFQRQVKAAASAMTGARKPAQPAEMLASEVDLLRMQVEKLRTEIVTLSGTRERFEKSRVRRYRTGVYSYLPPILRRQVSEVRQSRIHV